MIVTALDLRNFRSYERLQLSLGAGLVILTGPNGVGKTNCLESIAFGLTGTSPRTAAELRCIRTGSSFSRIQVTCQSSTTVTHTVVMEPPSGKRLTINDATAVSAASMTDTTPVVTFLPERLLVIRGAPARRRELLDRFIHRMNPSAHQILAQYAKVLQNRNTLLRRARAGADVTDAILPWTQQLAALGRDYRVFRDAAITALTPRFTARFEELTGMGGGEITATRRGAEDTHQALADAWPDDIRRGSTTTGPHRDDIQLLQAHRDLRSHGSTGEQRAALLAWSLATADLLQEQAGTSPILLLDEPYAELDQSRRRRLTAALQSFDQAILTTTEAPDHVQSLPDLQLFTVRSGAVEPWKTTSPHPQTPLN